MDFLVPIIACVLLPSILGPPIALSLGLILSNNAERLEVCLLLVLHAVICTCSADFNRKVLVIFVRGFLLQLRIIFVFVSDPHWRKILSIIYIGLSIIRLFLVQWVSSGNDEDNTERTKGRSHCNKRGGTLRILLSGDSFHPKIDGVATFTTKTIQYLQKNGHEVRALCAKANPGELFGASVTKLPGAPVKLCPDHLVSIPHPLQILLTLREFRPHLVHMFESGCLLNIVMSLTCWLLEIPTVMSHHTRIDLYCSTIVPFLPEWIAQLFLCVLFRSIISFNTLNLSVTNSLLRRGALLWYTNTLAGLKPRFWRSGTSVGNFSPDNADDDIRNRLSGDSPDVPLIIHIGRIALEKQSNEIPSIFEAVYKKLNGNVRFAVVGDGPILADVKAEMEEKIPGACVFTGFIRGKELYQMFASADLFFSPSAAEGFPLVYLEAMLSGLRVVGPDAGGVPDTFVDGEHGYLFQAHNITDGTNAVLRALADESITSRKVYKHAAQYTWEASLRQLEGYYTDALCSFDPKRYKSD